MQTKDQSVQKTNIELMAESLKGLVRGLGKWAISGVMSLATLAGADQTLLKTAKKADNDYSQNSIGKNAVHNLALNYSARSLSRELSQAKEFSPQDFNSAIVIAEKMIVRATPGDIIDVKALGSLLQALPSYLDKCTDEAPTRLQFAEKIDQLYSQQLKAVVAGKLDFLQDLKDHRDQLQIMMSKDRINLLTSFSEVRADLDQGQTTTRCRLHIRDLLLSGDPKKITTGLDLTVDLARSCMTQATRLDLDAKGNPTRTEKSRVSWMNEAIDTIFSAKLVLAGVLEGKTTDQKTVNAHNVRFAEMHKQIDRAIALMPVSNDAKELHTAENAKDKARNNLALANGVAVPMPENKTVAASPKTAAKTASRGNISVAVTSHVFENIGRT